MALHAVLVVDDSLLHVFLADLGAGVLVAAVAGVTAVVAADVAGLAVGRMVLVEAEVPLMVISSRLSNGGFAAGSKDPR